MSSAEGAEAGDLGEDLFIPEVTEVVRSTRGG